MALLPTDKLDQIEAEVVRLELERDEAKFDAENLIAGMREVALFRAANAQACLGGLVRPLLTEARRLEAQHPLALDVIEAAKVCIARNGWEGRSDFFAALAAFEAVTE